MEPSLALPRGLSLSVASAVVRTDWSLVLQVAVAAVFIAVPLALIASWQPAIGAIGIAVVVTAAAMVKPG